MKKGQWTITWLGILIVSALIIGITFLMLFTLTDVDKVKIADVSGVSEDLKNLHVLFAYLDFLVPTESGMVEMKDLITLYAQEPGKWRRSLETSTRVFFRKGEYYIGFYDEEPKTFDQRKFHIGSLEKQDRLDTIPELQLGLEILDYVPLYVSDDKFIWVALLKEQEGFY